MLAHDHRGQKPITAFFVSPTGLLLVGLLAIIGTYLWMEHRAHLGLLLWLPLLACPLMHLFMASRSQQGDPIRYASRRRNHVLTCP